MEEEKEINFEEEDESYKDSKRETEKLNGPILTAHPQNLIGIIFKSKEENETIHKYNLGQKLSINFYSGRFYKQMKVYDINVIIECGNIVKIYYLISLDSIKPLSEIYPKLIEAKNQYTQKEKRKIPR